MDHFRTLSEPELSMTLQRRERQTIFLLRRLLIKLGLNYNQHDPDQGFTSNDNLSLYGALVNVPGKNQFGDYEVKQMNEALLTSPLFQTSDGYYICAHVDWTSVIDYKP